MVMNRLALDHFFEILVPEMEVQITGSFIIYRNLKGSLLASFPSSGIEETPFSSRFLLLLFLLFLFRVDRGNPWPLVLRC